MNFSLDYHSSGTTIKPELKNQISFSRIQERGEFMARPAAKELTERELEVMHEFWNRGESTVAGVRDALASAGLDRAYTTVATLVRILADKGFLVQTNQERPFSYRPSQSYEEVSRKLLGDVIDRVFRGSRELLLVRLMEQRALSAKERTLLEELLRKGGKRP
jgi:BlaI family transcriptional regulator, penicillinase repressor